MKIIKVAAGSKTPGVAGAIAHAIRENGCTAAQGIGANAVNQMLKAIILVKQFLAAEGLTVSFTPEFVEVEIEGQPRTAVRLTIMATSAGNNIDEIAVTSPATETVRQNGLQRKMALHNAESPLLSGGDVDAAWDQADVGAETVGGSAPTPDQDRVDELGEAVGLTYADDEPLHTSEKLAERDRHRWELNPASASDNA